MNQEILAAQGRISNLKIEARRLALEIDDHRQAVRGLTAPLSNAEGYDVERIPMRAAQMAATVLAYRVIQQEIETLRVEYGIAE